jgi:chemotaxis protein CheC
METLGSIGQDRVARIRDLSERSMRRAGDALTTLLGRPISLAIVEIQSLTAAEGILQRERGDQGASIGLDFKIAGYTGGHALILLPQPAVFKVLHLLLGRSAEPHELDSLERSAIQELGNILASSFLSELGDLTGRRFMHSVPQIHLGDARSRMEELLENFRTISSEVLVIQARFVDSIRQLEGGFFVLPELAAFLPTSADDQNSEGAV